MYSLPGAKLDGERTAKWVNLKGTGFARGSWQTAVLAVDEKLSDLLGHCYVIHDHCELGIVHGAFLCRNTGYWQNKNTTVWRKHHSDQEHEMKDSAWRGNERGTELEICTWSKINFKTLQPMASKFRNFK